MLQSCLFSASAPSVTQGGAGTPRSSDVSHSPLSTLDCFTPRPHGGDHRLERIQTKAAKRAAGVPITTKNADALAEANMLPLRSRAMLLTYRYYLRCHLRGGSRRANAEACFPRHRTLALFTRTSLSPSPMGLNP